MDIMNSLMPFLLIIVILFVMQVRDYYKKDEEERAKVKRHIRSKDFILQDIFFIVGGILAFVGNVLEREIMKFGGIILLIVAIIFSTIHFWEEKRYHFLLTIWVILAITFFILLI